MTSNRLKQTPRRLSSSGFSSSYYTASVSRLPLSVGGSTVFPDDTVRNLGVTFDAQLTTRNHVENMVRSCFFQLRQLRSVRRSLTDEALHKLINAFIASRVDYCNALLYGVADGVIRRLQSVVHAAARLITGIRRYEHITSTLRDTLHWLPISQRIIFKIALMMFDCFRGRCPKYFGDLFTPVRTVAARSRLRSADHYDLVVPRAWSTCFGCRSFRVCGPTIWNKLPQDL